MVAILTRKTTFLRGRYESGTELVLPGGEPTALTVEDGDFSLDVSELVQSPLVSADLDPRDYPLIAMVLPGQTVEQTRSGDVVLQQAYMLSAPPSVRNITPLSTLVRQRRLNGVEAFDVGSSELAAALSNINLVSDYIRSDNQRAHTYARAFARFLASQFPDDYEDILRAGDGRERYLSIDAAALMGISFARNALEIIQIVDAAVAGGDYTNVDVDTLDLPVVALELEDSVIVDRQIVRAAGEGDSLPTSLSNVRISAELDFDYAEDGRLSSITANGCMMPSLKEMTRLINADGKIADTGTQWVPVSLSQQSLMFYEQEGPDERLTFDWENQTAAFETTTSCHPGLASSSGFGGPPAIVYEWVLSNTKVESIRSTAGSETQVLTPNYAFASDFFFGFTRRVDGAEQEVVTPDAVQSCVADILEQDLQKQHVVSALQPFTVSGAIPIPEEFTDLELELDTRDDRYRPLRYGFLNETFTNTPGVSNETGFEWSFFYPSDQSGNVVADQPNLPSVAYLSRFIGDRSCGRDFGSNPRSVYAKVDYGYLKLTEYLGGLIE